MDDLTGQRLDGYELLRLLGRGAMASVYLAEQASLARRVAVKVLSAELGRDEAYVSRFQHEARAAASLTHPGIVQVYEVGCATIDGEARHYIAQEYVAGGTLGRQLARGGAFEPARGLGVLWQVTSALAAASEQGLVHRDIKPDNLMLDRSGGVKVADFGLARHSTTDATRLTQAGVTLGTPLYMSPEQVEGREVDSRSDLYSLGVTAYQLLTGDPPFTADTPLAVAVQHLNKAPDPIADRRPNLPPELGAVIDRLLAKSPGDRFDSPSELLGVLRGIARRAEAEGWGDPSLDLTTASVGGGSWALKNDEAAAVVNRLGAAMREQTEAEAQSGGRRRKLLAGLVAASIVGAVLAWFGRPEPLIGAGPRAAVERADNVKTQLYLAKLADTPDAWRAVTDYFPEEDTFYQSLALRGYAVCTLRRGDNRLAMWSLERLISLAGEDPEFGPIGQAGLLIAYTRLGREDDARTVRGRLAALGSGSSDPFQSVAPDLSEEYRRSLRSLEATGS